VADIGQSAWSETDANNNQAAPDGFPEGMAPSGVNDAARAMMGAIKRFWDRINGAKTTGGTADAQTVTYDVPPPAYLAGERFLVRPSLTTTATAPSIAVNPLGAKTLKDATGSALVFGAALAAGTQAELMYDGTDMRVLSLPWKTGSFLPALTPSSGIINYATRDGYYFRLGPIVCVEGVVTCSSVSGLGSSSMKIVGLPYASAITTYGVACTAGGFNYAIYPNVGTNIISQINSGTTDVIIQIVETNGTVSILGPGMQGGTSIQFQGFYFTGAPF
jgi:hypothetical protein